MDNDSFRAFSVVFLVYEETSNRPRAGVEILVVAPKERLSRSF